LFGMLYALMHMRAVGAKTRRGALGFGAVALVAFAAALLSKAIVAPLPLALLLYDLLIARRPASRAITAAALGVALAAGELYLAWRAQADLGWIQPMPGGSFLGAASATIVVLARYLGMLVAPVRLSV